MIKVTAVDVPGRHSCHFSGPKLARAFNTRVRLPPTARGKLNDRRCWIEKRAVPRKR
jgi:hypothetical protein